MRNHNACFGEVILNKSAEILTLTCTSAPGFETNFCYIVLDP